MNLTLRRAIIAVTSVALRGIFRLFGGFRVQGLENVPATGAAILAPNHHSWADPPAIRSVIRRTCWFMGNHDLFEIRILGRLLPIYGAFPVRRGAFDRDAIRAAESHLKAGDLLCVFPEGGTTVTGRLMPFEEGVSLLALRNNTPIIPVAITGTDKVLPMKPPYRPYYAKGGVTLTFGTPIYPEQIAPDASRRERMELLTLRAYEAVRDLLPPEYRAAPDDPQPGRPIPKPSPEPTTAGAAE
jgi:1-acyl-sn-glycerol-3-phosphate acyltransferase